MLSSWSCWASMPVFEIHSERSMTLNFRSSDTPSSRKLEGGIGRIRPAYGRLIGAGGPRVPRGRPRKTSVLAEQLGRLLVLLLGVLQHLHLVLELPRGRDHADHGRHRAHVGTLERAGLQLGGRVGRQVAG